VIRVEAVSVEGGDTPICGVVRWLPSPRRRIPSRWRDVQIGSHVTGSRVSQKVTTVNNFGSHAPLRAASAQRVAASERIRHQAGRSHPGALWYGRRLFVRVRPVEAWGDGARADGGKWGRRTTQPAKLVGATVLATASSNEAVGAFEAVGSRHGIQLPNQRHREVDNEDYRQQGVNLVVDWVGRATLQSSILSLAYRGRTSMVAAAGREAMTVECYL
jgi:NADPH2:quinone reductase